MKDSAASTGRTAKTGIHAVTLSSDSETNTADAYKSEWTIAADLGKGQKFSYLTSWNGNGDGGDVYDQFADDGRLADTALDSSSSAGAVAVSAKLKPGETVTIPFTLTWDFPQVAFADDNTVWMRRYTEFYGAQTSAKNDYVPGSYPFHQSYEIAKDALEGREDALRDVQAWWEPVVESDTVPAEIGAAAMNQLANVTFHTSLWENGLVRNSVPVTKGGERIGTALPDTHNYFGTDSNSGGVSTLGQGGEIGIYSYSVYSDLFPFIERDRMRAKVEQIQRSDDGDPGDFDVTGSTDPAVYALGGDPFITWNPHNQSSNNPAPGAGLVPGPGTMSFLDRAAANVFRMYDYAQRNSDTAFLEFAYPAMNRVLDLLQKTIPSDSVLPEPTSGGNPQPGNVQQMANVYNAMPTDRFDAYTSAFYLLTLESMIASGELLGESHEKLDTVEGPARCREGEVRRGLLERDGGVLPLHVAARGRRHRDARHLAAAIPRRARRPAGPRRPRALSASPRLDVSAGGRRQRPEAARTARGRGRIPTGGARRASSTSPTSYRVPCSPPPRATSRPDSDSPTRHWSNRVSTSHGRRHSAVGDAGQRYEFNTPYMYGSAQPHRWIYPSFENNLSIWQLVDVLRASETTATVTASVKNLRGNENELTITVTETGRAGETTEYTAVHRIRNNASGTFDVGPYRVYVESQGPAGIRESYIVPSD